MARPKSTEETLNVCGTVAYLPPEAVVALETEQAGYRGIPADCWSAGVILYIMLACALFAVRDIIPDAYICDPARGYHPFDQEVTTWGSYSQLFGRDTFYDQQRPNHSRLSQAHVPFDLNERSAKERIKNGWFDLSAAIWDSLVDGTPSIVLIEPAPSQPVQTTPSQPTQNSMTLLHPQCSPLFHFFAAETLIRRLLIHNPQHRATSRGAMASDWFYKEAEQLEIAFNRLEQQHRRNLERPNVF